MAVKVFVTGIGTEVGKTIASAILVESLEADYWKPIQAGDLDHSDTKKVTQLISNKKSIFHPNSYALNTAMSPHAAAKIDDIHIQLDKIVDPETNNNLIIEGAGGLFVPLNDKECILDIISTEYKVILISRHYLGSINHSLLSIECLKRRSLNLAGIIFSGDEHESTESIILGMTGVPMIGRIQEEEAFNPAIIKNYAEQFRPNLKKVLGL